MPFFFGKKQLVLEYYLGVEIWVDLKQLVIQYYLGSSAGLNTILVLKKQLVFTWAYLLKQPFNNFMDIICQNCNHLLNKLDGFGLGFKWRHQNSFHVHYIGLPSFKIRNQHFTEVQWSRTPPQDRGIMSNYVWVSDLDWYLLLIMWINLLFLFFFLLRYVETSMGSFMTWKSFLK